MQYATRLRILPIVYTTAMYSPYCIFHTRHDDDVEYCIRYCFVVMGGLHRCNDNYATYVINKYTYIVHILNTINTYIYCYIQYTILTDVNKILDEHNYSL